MTPPDLLQRCEEAAKNAVNIHGRCDYCGSRFNAGHLHSPNCPAQLLRDCISALRSQREALDRLVGILQNVSNDIHANRGYVSSSVGGQVDGELLRRGELPLRNRG